MKKYNTCYLKIYLKCHVDKDVSFKLNDSWTFLNKVFFVKVLRVCVGEVFGFQGKTSLGSWKSLKV